MATLEFFYDIGSPYSYLASTRVEDLADGAGARLRWRPMLLGGVFKATGNMTPVIHPLKRTYILQDLQRWADWYGVPFHLPRRFPPNTLTAMRVLTGLPEELRVRATHDLFRAYWVDDIDISDPSALAAVVGRGAVTRARDADVKRLLRATTDEAVARGAFGAPTMYVGDKMFFGNDRLHFVEMALRKAALNESFET